MDISQYKLNSKKIKGFTTCSNPYINFTSTSPTKSEAAEIYRLLESGVYF